MRSRLILCAMVCLVTTSCHRVPLQCRSEYLYPTSLASNEVDTPDPCRVCYYGQQVVVRWNVGCVPEELVLDVRYGNGETEQLVWPIHTSSGYRVYRLVNEAYWCVGGVVAFKAWITSQGQTLTTWEHRLWCDKLEIGEP